MSAAEQLPAERLPAKQLPAGARVLVLGLSRPVLDTVVQDLAELGLRVQGTTLAASTCWRSAAASTPRPGPG